MDGVRIGYANLFSHFFLFCGAARYFPGGHYVRRQYRRREWEAHCSGGGVIGMERDCGRFEWIALRWNESALKFYENLGARVLNEWAMLRMDSTGIRNLAEARQSHD